MAQPTGLVPYSVPIGLGAGRHHPHELGLEFAEHTPLPLVIRRTLRQMLRSALYAATARLIFGLLKSILKGGISKTALRLARGEVFSLNPLKWAALIGMLSSYRGTQQVLERGVPALGKPASSVLAGAATSLGFFAMNVETRTELALYTGVRAAHGLLVGYVWPQLPAVLRDFPHWDVVTMSADAMQIFYSLFFFPNQHSAGYLRFLQNCTMLDPAVFPATSAFHRSQTVPEMVDFCAKRGLTLPADPTKVPLKELCNYFHSHPGQSCPSNVFSFITRHIFGFSLRLYLPLKIITTALFGRKKALEQPLWTLQKVAKDSLSSSMFLTLYCGLPWALICMINNANLRSPALVAFVGGAAAGIPTLLEPKSRRADLALYCTMHAFRAFYLNLVNFGWVARPTRHHLTVLSTAAMAAIWFQYDFQRDAVHRNLLNVLSWLLKERAPLHPKHHDEHQPHDGGIAEAPAKDPGHHQHGHRPKA